MKNNNQNSEILFLDKFEILTGQEKMLLQESTTLIKSMRGEFIYTDGSNRDSIYYLIGGKIKLCNRFRKYDETVMDIVFSNNFFGISSISGKADEMSLAVALKILSR